MSGLQRDVYRYLDDDAPRLLERYYRSGKFTGARFDFFAGGGARQETRHRFTSDDIVAVSFLDVTIPSRAVLAVLEDQQEQLADHLARIPTEVGLTEPGAERLSSKGSSADLLWRQLVRIDGIGWVTAHKLLARKRPHLLPVYDRVVKAALQPTRRDFWRPLWETLQGPVVVDRLHQLRDGLGLELSLLRILDVSVWMRNWGAAEGDRVSP